MKKINDRGGIKESSIKEIIDVANRLYEKNLNGGYGGNLSIRINDKKILITRSGIPKVNLRENDIAILDIDGNFLRGKPSSEYKMHLYTYQQCYNIKAILHAHPPCLMGMALAGISPPTEKFPETNMLIGHIPVSPFFPSGSDDLAIAVAENFKSGAVAVLMENHGITVVSEHSLWDAYYKLEAIEHVCMANMVAKTLKGAIE